MSSIFLPAGVHAPRVTGLPAGDLRLGDGRRLRFEDGAPLPVQADADTRFLASGLWRGPQRLTVLGSLDPTPHGDLLHVSMSYPDRDPDWATIRAIRDLFYPSTVDVMMVLPRAEDYVNIHRHVFHLWQTPTVWGLR